MKKLFVLDTNVILSDARSIFNFQEHDIVIPITVLEELDKFKKGFEPINFNAREFIRSIEDIFKGTEKLIAKINKSQGRLILTTDDQKFHMETPDNRIIQLTRHLQNKHPKREVVLVSRDINLRIKARVLGINAEDYETDRIEDPNKLYMGHGTLLLSSDQINEIYREGFIENPFSKKFVHNQYFLIKTNNDSSTQSALVKFNGYKNVLLLITDQSIAGIHAKNMEQKFMIDALLDPQIQLLSVIGISGSGKTLLTLASAIHQKRNYLQIFLSKPTIPVGSDIGFLPGTIEDKIKPYMQSYYDNLEVIKHTFPKEKVFEDMLTNNKMQIAPIQYIRGRSLPRIFFVIDETQNCTLHELKSLITRAGEGTKIVLLGDINQIDSPYLDSHNNGLSLLINKMKDQSFYAHLTLTKGERSALSEAASLIL